MADTKSVDIETLIAQVRAGMADPRPAPWPITQKLVAFLCDAMTSMVGEIRAARDAEAYAKEQRAQVEARALDLASDRAELIGHARSLLTLAVAYGAHNTEMAARATLNRIDAKANAAEARP